jgi:hypothetical protein
MEQDVHSHRVRLKILHTRPNNIFTYVLSVPHWRMTCNFIIFFIFYRRHRTLRDYRALDFTVSSQSSWPAIQRSRVRQPRRSTFMPGAIIFISFDLTALVAQSDLISIEKLHILLCDYIILQAATANGVSMAQKRHLHSCLGWGSLAHSVSFRTSLLLSLLTC